MVGGLLNRYTFMFVFLVLILIADYAAFFRVYPSFVKRPSIRAEAIGDDLGN